MIVINHVRSEEFRDEQTPDKVIPTSQSDANLNVDGLVAEDECSIARSDEIEDLTSAVSILLFYCTISVPLCLIRIAHVVCISTVY